VLFSHPKDFTPVCTTELGYMARIKPEFDKRGVKIIGLSVDPVDRHGLGEGHQGDARLRAELPDDRRHRLNVSKLYGMLPAPVSGDPTKRTAADNQTVRNVFVIGPDKKIKLILVYPMTTGRNFDEVLRVIDSLQLTAKHKVATPVNWKQGDDVIIAGSVTDEDAKKIIRTAGSRPSPTSGSCRSRAAIRRFGDGTWDRTDFEARTRELAEFVARAVAAYRLPKPVALGYSNGANIAWSLLLKEPKALAGAILMRAMLPFDPRPLPDLRGIPVLLLAGAHDELIPPERAGLLAALLGEAGADVTYEVLPLGHGLGEQDLRLAASWLASRWPIVN
jgi:thioredoxin-dependent peroxiredoxin